MEYELKQETFYMPLKKEELMKILNVSYQTVDRLISDGKIEYLKVNTQVRFTKKHIDDYILANTHGGKNANDGEK